MKPFAPPPFLRIWLGIERNTTTHAEKWISAVGGFFGILAVSAALHFGLPQGLAGTGAAGAVMLASFGASAVLLFAVPHGALSQPWAIGGGHLVSAAVGVTCQKLFPGQPWTPALAAGAAVGAMYYLRCIHPPGGATSLAAVIGSEDLHALGYHYLLAPVGVSVLAILFMAVAYNALFPWRRYPVHLHRRRRDAVEIPSAQRQFDLTQEDFAAAMAELNSYVDINEESLTELLELAKQHAERDVVHPETIAAGHRYSNGRLGKAWQVREVGLLRGDLVDFRVTAGEGLGQIGSCAIEEFRQWARYEVRLEQGRWIK